MARSRKTLQQRTASEQNQQNSSVRYERPARKRRGPKPKQIKDRELKLEDMRPIRRPERSWSQRQKIRVLVFLYHHRIPTKREEYRSPTQQEAADVFCVPQRTISEWVKNQKKIEQYGMTSGVRSARTVQICRWPELEAELYQLFLERRALGQPIRRGWFRIYAGEIFHKLYPDANSSVFRFSVGWFKAFLGRYRVSLRCITKKAQKIPADYHKLVINWMQFNRRNSQPDPSELHPVCWMEVVLCRAVGRYHLSNICNLDETPLPFEYLNGRTYDIVGSKTIWVKETRSGWDKRQASLVLCIFADGINRIPPMIIFHGKGSNTKPFQEEQKRYHPGVIVEFNETAYMNDALFLKYIELYLIPVLGGRPSLFALDMCTSHKTPAVLDTLRKQKIIPSLIPAGCTSLVQPLDVSINKPLKEHIRSFTEEAIQDCESAEEFERWTVGDRRVLTTCAVGDAWYQFAVEKQEIIKRVFRKVGLSLPIDGSADHELDVKGFEKLEIGDWRRDSGLEDELDLEPEDQFADVEKTNDDHECVEFVAHGEE